MASMPDLTGMVAIVTGGTRGIGLAITTVLAEAGATVVPTSRTETDVNQAVAVVRDAGSDSLAIPTDVTDRGAVESLFDDVATEFGGINILVTCAGVNPLSGMGAVSGIDTDAFEHVIDVNLGGTFTCLAVAEPYLRAGEGGSVVTVSSIAGLIGLPRQHSYVASKHGVVGLTRSTAIDWAPTVRVNTVAPGYVDTEMTESLRNDETLYENVTQRIPARRFADPFEVANVVLFLVSDMASYITGSQIVVDGGWTAQ